MRAMIFATAMLLLAAGHSFAQDQAPASAPAPAGSPGDSLGNAASAPAASTTDAAAAPPSAPADPHAIDPSVPAMTGPQIVIATTMGNITLQLDATRAPKTTASVLRYVKLKHYDGTVFYRVVKGVLIQMGSWDAKGVGRSSFANKLPLEVNNGLSNVRGTVGLARGDEPDSAGADFFINVGDEIPARRGQGCARQHHGLCRIRQGDRRHGCGGCDQCRAHRRRRTNARPGADDADHHQQGDHRSGYRQQPVSTDGKSTCEEEKIESGDYAACDEDPRSVRIA